MASSPQPANDDCQDLVAKLSAQVSSMQAGFGAYAQVVKHHSLVLIGVQKGLEDAENDNKAKDIRIDVLERRINELEEMNAQKQPQEQYDEGPSSQSAIGAALEEQNTLIRQMMEEKDDEITELEQEIARLRAGDADGRGSAEGSVPPGYSEKKAKASEENAEARATGEKSPEEEKEKIDEDLINAARNGMLEDVKALIAIGAHVDAADSLDRTALWWAASLGNFSVVEVLITNGANLDATHYDGWTTLMEAACRGRADIVEALTRAGASLNTKDNNGNTALDHAFRRDHQEVVNILRRADAKRARELRNCFIF